MDRMTAQGMVFGGSTTTEAPKVNPAPLPTFICTGQIGLEIASLIGIPLLRLAFQPSDQSPFASANHGTIHPKVGFNRSIAPFISTKSGEIKTRPKTSCSTR